MRGIRQSAIHYMRILKIHGLTAARLKRMPAIRRKLCRVKWKLHQLQDLGGCRCILPTINDVKRLVDTIKTKSRYDLKSEDDYITNPKEDGYRSHHIILIYKGRKPSMHDGRRIELQVRTQLQHSWATAIESVGLIRGEELKNHKGSEDWLRLFKLMSAEFAEAEQCPIPPSTPEKPERQTEIMTLSKSLDALNVLDSVSNGFRGTDIPLAPGYKPSHFLITYDRIKRTVEVQPYDIAINATRSYDNAEALSDQGNEPSQNIVLVEVGKLNLLKKAYPNYFGDVELFGSSLFGMGSNDLSLEA
jgi:hypothetical protein